MNSPSTVSFTYDTWDASILSSPLQAHGGSAMLAGIGGDLAMKSISVAALAVLMSGCVSAPPTPTPTPATTTSTAAAPVVLSDADRAAIEAGTRASLPNAPADATFRTMTATRGSDGVVTACGYVNAKDSSGGNTGDKPFIGVMTGAGFSVTAMGGSDAETIAVQAQCARHRINI
jgi:hypothetical protein